MIAPIEAILFDMGGTLRRTILQEDEAKLLYAAGRIAEILGASPDPAAFARLLSERAAAYKQWAETTLVELSEPDLWTRWMLPDFPAEQVAPLAVQLNQFWRDAVGLRIVYPETGPVVLELFRRGYRLGLVSNTTSSIEVPRTMTELGIFGCFETYILSCEVGMRKPGPDILLEATGRMGVRPERCAYVGDRPDRDVASARQAGFSKTILHRDPDVFPAPPAGPGLDPDHTVANLKELLELFPARRPTSGRSASAGKPEAITYDACLSTMWAGNFPTLGDFLLAARRLGFSSIELNHHVDSAQLAGIDWQAWRFSSVHEPCPADVPVETLVERDWLPSALDEADRRRGVEAICRSLDLAHKLRAHTVVIHAGNVLNDRTLEKQLRSLYDRGQTGSDQYQEIKEKMMQTRRDLVGPRLAALQKSLVELLEYAAGTGVRLGLENRYHYLEFPSPDELETLLELAGPDRLGFIFDVGHAMALERLCFYPYEEWLKRFSPRILGSHLHDVIGLTDHYAPGLGEVDFDVVSAHLPPESFRTYELKLFNSSEQVKASLTYLAERKCIRQL